jgi:peptidoglycan/xylan/chitin deacetylase (PgdA/CDA1 family)
MNIPILMYHNIQNNKLPVTDLSVSLRSFVKQMTWMSKRGYHSISLEQLAKALRGEIKLPPKKVVITFDDAYQSVWQLAKPVLDQLNYTATVFVVPKALGQYNIWDKDKPTPIWPCLEQSHCQQLLDQGWEIGAHGLHHHALTGLDHEQATEEIAGSKTVLEEMFHTKIKSFCYPFGAWNQPVRDLVKQAGFETACAISPGTGTVTEDPWALRRIYVKGKDHLVDFQRKVSNWYLSYRGWRKK